MTCTNQQVKALMKNLVTHNQKVSALRSGMDVKTARKYIAVGKLPSELVKPHEWSSQPDAFSGVWVEVEGFLKESPRLQAKTMLEYLIRKYPGCFKKNQLRTLQRRFRNWRAEKGKNQPVIFCQNHKPGEQSQSDYTVMNSLGITIAGEVFNHIVFHFMLVYSKWESVNICHTESFDSLAHGYEKAVWELGHAVKEHRTDNLTAAVKKDKTFTDRWKLVMKHYGVEPSRNNPGESHENGSVEKSNHLFKVAVEQALILRGHRDFQTIDCYRTFLEKTVAGRNNDCKEALLKEITHLKELPADKWYSPQVRPVTVSPSSTIHINCIPYSVPSRLVGYALKAHVFPDKIDLYYGNKQLQSMPISNDTYAINYRHIIESLVRKPGAFRNYQYREALFPRMIFRQAYDCLLKQRPCCADKSYLKLLLLAKQNGEEVVAQELSLLLDAGEVPTKEAIKERLEAKTSVPDVSVKQPALSEYDQLLEKAS